VTSVHLQVPLFQIVQGTHQAATATAQASGLSSPVDITLLATYSSDNTNVITVTNNVLYAIGQGSANITASFGGQTSSSVAITVVQPASLLTHRYSFSDPDGSATVADSVGGAAWAGAVTEGGASAPGSFSAGQLSVLSANTEYVQFPAGIISNYSAVTLEAWATFPSTLPGNCFFFGFGNTDAGGAGESYIYLQPSSGHIGITGSDPGWQGPEDQAGTYGNLSLKTNVHIAAVFNPGAGWIAVYTNGVLAGKNTSVRWTLGQVSSVLNYLARSLYTGDSYMDVNLDEFRIFSGALTSQELAISDIAGADSLPAAVTNGPGPLQSFTVQVPSTLPIPFTGQVKVLANYANLTNWDIIQNSIFPPAGLTLSSSDTNVAYIGTDSLLHSKYPGVTTVTITYQGVTNSATVTVLNPPAIPALAHRYSFTDANGSTSVADSVGGPAWNGTVMSDGINAVPAPGAFANGMLSLSAANTNFVQLPSGILSNYASVTIEGWVTAQTLPANSMYYAFGATDATGLGANYLFGSLVRDYTAITGADPGYTAEQGTAGGPALPLNTPIHFTAVYDSPEGYIALYTNGVLQSINTGVTTPLSAVSPVEAFIGRSLYNPDPYASLQLDEFRIYNGVLSPAELAATQMLGPDQVLTTAVNVKATLSGGTVTLSWPAAAAGFTLMSKPTLPSGTWSPVSPAATLVGTQWQVTVPTSGGAKFFRLGR
jgi:hypothetical protein